MTGLDILPTTLFHVIQPTSGLDSTTSNEVVQLIKRIQMGQNSSTGKITVAMTIHSPTAAAFSLFDRLFVLVRGRLVFFGTAGECISHFERVNGRALAMGDNPSEFILDIIVAADAKDQGLELSSAYQEVTDGVEKALSLRQGTFIQSSAADLQPITLASIAQMKRFKSSFATPWWYQIFVLIRFRGLRSYSDLGWVLPRALERVLFAVFMTVLYVNTVQNFNPSTDATTLAAFLYLVTLWSISSTPSHQRDLFSTARGTTGCTLLPST